MVTALFAALLALALVGATPGAPSTRAAEEPGRFLVRVASGTAGLVADEVRDLGGRIERQLRQVGVLVASLPASAADRLRERRGVLAVTPDASVRLEGSTYDAKDDAGSMFSITQVTRAREVWGSGITGRGVDVALIDSGIAPVAGLTAPGKVVNGPDISFESQNPDTRYLDTFGHGTFMAGIIAGSDGSTSPSSYAGMAPGARLISLKVADARGNADVSQVIAAIDWVVQHRKDPGMNIRVLNLSFGTPSLQSYLLDPLAYAAEVAWHKGIVVVVSAGNDGTGTGKLLNPAQDPFVIAVGAEDSRGTPAIFDDTIPDFSTRGDGRRNPDIVAPGASVQGLRVPGSYVDLTYGSTAAFGERFFRGSGTSQAAAVVSGAAALLLEHRPWLSPDQVKALLMRTARTLPSANVQAQGRGLVDVQAATQALAPLTTQLFTRSTGTGTLDGARGTARLVLDGVTLSGEKDIFGKAYVSASRAAEELAETSWDGGVWNGSSWAGSSWAGSSWAGSSWASSAWATGGWG